MGHRAAVYTVGIHRRNKPDDVRLLGDIDEQGHRLSSALASYMDDFESVSADKSKFVRVVESTGDGDELRLVLQHGQNGLAADIVNDAGDLRIRQEASDVQRVRCGVLLSLPRAETLGWMAVHNNNNRYVKGLFMQALGPRFRREFPDLVLRVSPYVLGSVLREAVDQDRVEKITLVKLERPNDRSNMATNKWVRATTSAKVELGIEAKGRRERVIPDLLRRFLHGDVNAYEEIVVYEGLTFDEARVQVRLENGYVRTFNIEHPDAGHAFTEDMRDLELQADGEPTDVSIFAGLRAALSTVGS